jgi:hypothetical protein
VGFGTRNFDGYGILEIEIPIPIPTNSPKFLRQQFLSKKINFHSKNEEK